MSDPYHAFCPETRIRLKGAASGPLQGLRFAAKEIFDIAGHVTPAGQPDWERDRTPATRTAAIVQRLLEQGAELVGRTTTDELTRGIFGENTHAPSPINPRAPEHVPGGSSCGSAAATAGGLVDFALGSDTFGSVRVPASYCGLFGLRPTHGRLSLDGVFPQAESYDTVGWFAADPERFSRVGRVLFGDLPDSPARRHLCLLEDAFRAADPKVGQALRPLAERLAQSFASSCWQALASDRLEDWPEQQLVLQGREAWNNAADWIDRVNPRLHYRVARMYLAASQLSESQWLDARAKRDRIRARVEALTRDGGLLCLPTTPTPAPRRGERESEREAVQRRTFALLTIASSAGVPQVHLPLAVVDGLPIGLSLIGARHSDEELLVLAAEVASEFGVPEYRGSTKPNPRTG